MNAGALEFDTRTKLAIYQHFAATGERPSPVEVAEQTGASVEQTIEAFGRLAAQRVLVLEDDAATIRMAPPFSGVPTQHVVEIGPLRYFANCGWDAFGVPAALHKPATIHSRCAQSGEPFRLEVDADGHEPSSWLFHCLVPAVKWWDDIGFT